VVSSTRARHRRGCATDRNCVFNSPEPRPVYKTRADLNACSSRALSCCRQLPLHTEGPTLTIHYAPRGHVDHVHAIHRHPTNDHGATFSASSHKDPVRT
jgi:hypothetical protein